LKSIHIPEKSLTHSISQDIGNGVYIVSGSHNHEVMYKEFYAASFRALLYDRVQVDLDSSLDLLYWKTLAESTW
jgi:hypothetical protein